MNGAHLDLARLLGMTIAPSTSDEDVRAEARRQIAGSTLKQDQKETAARYLRAALLSHKTRRRS